MGGNMKRNSVLAVLVLVSFLLTSCGGVSIDNYNAVSKERDELLIQKANLESEYLGVLEERDDLLQRYEIVPATITGQFTATDRATLPDYVMGDTTHTVAIVNCFQDSPFAVYLGARLISQVEIGKTYVFEIEETEIQLQRQQCDGPLPSPAEAVALYGVEVAAVRKAEENDLGLNGYHLEYKPAE